MIHLEKNDFAWSLTPRGFRSVDSGTIDAVIIDLFQSFLKQNWTFNHFDNYLLENAYGKLIYVSGK